MELSNRLQAVANLISDGLVVADVGTDHGYIPIYLLETKRCPRAFAMDVNEGPLQRAREHIHLHELSEKIETRLSDGVSALQVGEAECVVIAGMGGALTIRIMEQGKEVFRNLKEFVLQPQSEIAKVRQYLTKNDFYIVSEDMVLEDGKFYPMMKVKNGQSPEYNVVEFQFGRCLLEQKHPVLKLFLEKEMRSKAQIVENLKEQSGEHIAARREALCEELAKCEAALSLYE